MKMSYFVALVLPHFLGPLGTSSFLPLREERKGYYVFTLKDSMSRTAYLATRKHSCQWRIGGLLVPGSTRNRLHRKNLLLHQYEGRVGNSRTVARTNALNGFIELFCEPFFSTRLIERGEIQSCQIRPFYYSLSETFSYEHSNEALFTYSQTSFRGPDGTLEDHANLLWLCLQQRLP